MITRTVRLLLLALLLAAPAAATHSPWPDPRHGWEVRCDEDGLCNLYSTEDGGRHWHVIFSGETDDVNDYLRTSARAGVISINYKAPEQYWTRDNGRHWHFTRRLPPFFAGGWNLAGKGRFLFWSHAGAVYQVSNWPPRRRTELRVRLVDRFRDGSFSDLASVPGGFAAALLRDSAVPSLPLGRVLLRRNGKNYLVRLRDPVGAVAARVRSLVLFASWPELIVLAEDDHGNPLYTWKSSDGGRTWLTPAVG